MAARRPLGNHFDTVPLRRGALNAFSKPPPQDQPVRGPGWITRPMPLTIIKLPRTAPIIPTARSVSFNHPAWLFEPKYGQPGGAQALQRRFSQRGEGGSMRAFFAPKWRWQCGLRASQFSAAATFAMALRHRSASCTWLSRLGTRQARKPDLLPLRAFMSPRRSASRVLG